MIFDDTASKALKKYLSYHLEPICDADPAVLADYIIALLQNDKSSQDLRQTCIDQLDDFLKEETIGFVNKLFIALYNREYLDESDDNKKAYDHSSEKNENSSAKSGVRKRDESEGSDEDDDRNYKHREKGGGSGGSGDNREDYRRYSERTSSNRDDDRDSKNKRFRGEGIPTGPSSGSSQYNNNNNNSNYQDDRNFKRRRDEPEEEYRSNKIPRNNLIANNQNLPGNGNGYSSASGRWVNEWNGNGMSAPTNDRYDDRRIRAGRVGTVGSRGGSIMINRTGYPDNRSPTGRRQRCRDYDEKGYCMRGDLCPFDHGADRIVVDDVQLNRPYDLMPPITSPLSGPVGLMAGVPPRPPFYLTAPTVRGQFELDTGGFTSTSRSMTPTADAYDPERATLSRPEELLSSKSLEQKEVVEGQSEESSANEATTISLTQPSSMATFLDATLQQQSAHLNASGAGAAFRGRARSRGTGRGGFSGRYGTQPNKSSTLVVERIPNEFCYLDKVNDFFKRFGIITNINVDVPNQKAIIQFSSNQEAQKAYNSPEPIFGNRFVKVYWLKDKEEQQNSIGIKQPFTTTSTVSKQEGTTAAPAPMDQQTAAEKTKEAEEKAKKQKENIKTILEIQKQREQLIRRQIEESKRLMELSKKKTVDAKSREELLNTLNKVSEGIKKDTNVPTLKPIMSSTSPAPFSKSLMEEKEREQLDRELDILSKLNETGGTLDSSSLPKGPTTFYGRTRGIWPRVRGGSVIRSYKLDNRSSKLLIKDFPVDSFETLKTYFQQLGEVESFVKIEEDKGVIVHFKNRKDAEQALMKGTNIPNVGVVQMTWYSETNSVAQSSEITNTTATVENSESQTTATNPDIKIETTTSTILESTTETNEKNNFEKEEDDDDRERSWKR